MFLGAVDSVIYTTTRKLIKPINFPNHLRTFSSDNSSTKTGVVTLSRSPSSIKGPSMCRDKSSHDLSAFAGHSPMTYSDPSKVYTADAYDDSRVNTVHVTLERIQEVI
jgi:hypothetical protein